MSRVIFGDSRCMDHLADKSIHLVVTSPPYWCIKDYGSDNQIGYGQSYEEYLESMALVWSECYRVLHPGCRMVINIGDQFLSAKEHGRYRVSPIAADTISSGIAVGFDFMGNIIWGKVPTCNPSGGGTFMGSLYYPKDGHLTFEHEYIMVFRKPGKWPKPLEDAKEKSKLTKEERSEWFRARWNFPGAKQSGHVAMFPYELPYRIIKMWSFFGETVLDPFVGSGTTLKVADDLGRFGIGYEINKDFEDLITEKVPGVVVQGDVL